jgi:hypothetical protein
MKRHFRFRILLASLAVGILLPALAGCGGGLSQADMMKNAIQRPGDEEEEQGSGSSPLGGTEGLAAEPGGSDSGSTDPAQLAADGDQGTPPITVRSGADADAAADAAEVASDDPVEADGPTEEAGASPEQPQTLVERRQRTIDNLTRISEALQSQVDADGFFCDFARRDLAGEPLLSWRVELLPALGYEKLYARFNLDQPWDSPHNRKLLSEIPPVYQSPERADEHTNYLLCAGSAALFRPGGNVLTIRVEDGLSHTLMLVEVDDELAVPWTKPADYDVDRMQPMQGLSGLRDGYCFVAWADGRIAQLKGEDMQASWRSMFTIDGGERFSANKISMAPTAEPPKEPDPIAQPVVKSEDEPAAPLDAANAEESATGWGADTELMLSKMQQPLERKLNETPPDWRQPVPTPNDREAAIGLLRATYYPQYEDAKTDEDKSELAARLMKEADTFQTDPVGRYVTLDLARKIAAEGGDLKNALDAVEKILKQFQADEVTLFAEVLATTSRKRLTEEENDTILERVEEWIRLAIREEQFDKARDIQDAALAAARRNADRKRVVELARYTKRIDQAEAARVKLIHSVGSVSLDATDPESCTQAGAYYCFVKKRWDEGFALLMRGSDPRLAEIADWELHGNDTLEKRLRVADRWWELSEVRGPYQHAMQQRAVFWYRDLLPQLEPGLHRVKAELRLEEADDVTP